MKNEKTLFEVTNQGLRYLERMVEEWFKIDGSFLKNLVESIRRRILAVIAANRYPTWY
ncbi:8081_t:CDS:2 [Scutellospora calospora]|uniref:8081_t:CDS:1 n=1 Tax=Scutellospora calospora TaxID=85575 RepID=A0ACA9JZZ1_9GLOM|nr:8081_t:CDS:2 [Scutellospora calospora]